jgi:protein subunit release factor A
MTEQRTQLLDMPKVVEKVKELEAHLNNAIRKGAYDMREISEMFTCVCVIAEVVKACDKYQQILTHLSQQQELVKEAEQLDEQKK